MILPLHDNMPQRAVQCTVLLSLIRQKKIGPGKKCLDRNIHLGGRSALLLLVLLTYLGLFRAYIACPRAVVPYFSPFSLIFIAASHSPPLKEEKKVNIAFALLRHSTTATWQLSLPFFYTV